MIRNVKPPMMTQPDTDIRFNLAMERGEVREALGGEVPLTEPDVMDWIKDYINEGLSNLRGGVL